MKKVIIALCVALVVFAVGYNAYQSEKRATTGKRKVYAVLPLSGQFAEYGKDVQKVIDLKMRESNHLFEIIYVDSEAAPAKAISAFTQASINDPHPIVISAFAFISSVLAPIVEKRNGFMFAISTVAVTSDTHNYVKIFRSIDDVLNAITPYITTNFKKVSIVYTLDDYGLSEYKALKNKVTGTNTQIAQAIPLDLKTRDVRIEVLKLLADHPEAIIVLGMTTQGYINIFKELKAQEYKGVIIADSGLTNPPVLRAIGKDALEGVILSAMVAETEAIQTPDMEKLKQELAQQNLGIYYILVEAIDTLNIIQYTLEKNLPFTQKTYEDIGLWKGTAGNIFFLNNGEVASDAYIAATIKNGRIVPITEGIAE